jgi:hypothetical protein
LSSLNEESGFSDAWLSKNVLLKVLNSSGSLFLCKDSFHL